MVALLVDDEAAFRRLFTRMLARAGWEAVEAADGVEALDYARSRSFAVVITDIDMPRMDGLELCRRLRESPETRHVPIVVMTGGERGPEAVSAGADFVLEKPVSLDVLVEVLGRVPSGRA